MERKTTRVYASGKDHFNWAGGRVKRAGYWYIHSPEHPHCTKAGYVVEHRLVAEAAIGRVLPRKAVVHHVDGDRTNNIGTNLVICEDEAYHRLIHRRARIVARGGNPNLNRICSACDQVLLKTAFYVNRASYDGRSGKCRKCTLAYMKLRHRQKQLEKRKEA